MDTPDGARKKCQRFNIPGDVHELTFSCYKRRPFLSADRSRTYLAQAIAKARDTHGFHLWAYVFMLEHVPLLVWPPRPEYSVSSILQSIKQSVSRKALIYLRRHNPKGLRHLATGQKHSPYHFWQDGGGYDRNLTSTDAMRASLDYIHNNPVRKSLVAYPEDWPWSSAKAWAGSESGPLSIDKESVPAL